MSSLTQLHTQCGRSCYAADVTPAQQQQQQQRRSRVGGVSEPARSSMW
ncbi:hypothetical protein F443_00101 [Phytophthora nicotianae P1569]|uniref:Uncharacterized protein n=2 Tax=Phytophthora nicotianae TaxID=4792 RepID=V9G2V5_PHYNI|nr:hypothetical protein F443_00101 [Phytophthora nicotianae P1569]ETO86352.1 hypothetical protein F444_00098 [Phytophthora nicotianae P1976]